MGSLIEQNGLPRAIQTDAQYHAYKNELYQMHDAFAAGNIDSYSDDRFRAIVALLRAYRPKDTEASNQSA